jgi:hypothetical protein
LDSLRALWASRYGRVKNSRTDLQTLANSEELRKNRYPIKSKDAIRAARGDGDGSAKRASVIGVTLIHQQIAGCPPRQARQQKSESN